MSAAASEKDVVLGTGALGRAVARQLLQAGRRVRLVNRSGQLDEPPAGAELHRADLTDPAAAALACAGSQTAYLCANVPYNDWPRQWPPLVAGILAGAIASGAKLVYGDNLYAYGPVNGPIREDCPEVATGKKGRLRARLAKPFLDAHRAGQVRVAIGRASDFFGPWAAETSAIGSRVIPAALAGRRGMVLGDIDQPHTYTYIDDYARGLVTLGTRDEALGQIWHVPSAATTTTRKMLEMVWAEAGGSSQAAGKLNVMVMRRGMVKVVGLFNPIVRELDEMMYEWEKPYVVDHSKFERVFGTHVTAHDQAIADTVAWFRSRQK
jgi:nucleoside-diphosphate-sugar epimerase